MSAGSFADLTNTYNLDIDFANIDRLIITDQLNIQSDSEQITFGQNDEVIFDINTTNLRTYTLPSLPNSEFVMSDGNQSIAGIKTFTGTVNLTSAIVQGLPVDDITIQNTGDELAVKDDGISTAKLADSSVTDIKVSPGIDAVKIADGTVTNTEFQYLNSATSNIQTQITNNVTNIATNTTDIATNVTNIATNTTDIATNVTNIATNTTDIATNVTNIATNTTDIATNTTDIATNTTDIATNTTDIATNTTDIATNIINIANNTAAIAAFPIELQNLTAAEIAQLENIGINTISNTQWGYLSAMNQGVSTTSSPMFSSLAVSTNSLLNTVIATGGLFSNTLTAVTLNSDLTLAGSGTGKVVSADVFNVTDATNATNTTTGSIITAGGLGVAKDIFCNNLEATGAINTLGIANVGGGLTGIIYIGNGSVTNGIWSHTYTYDQLRYRTSNQSIPNSTTTIIICNSLSGYGTGAYNGTTGIWTCPLTGLYSIHGFIRFSANSTGNRILSLNKNGSSIISSTTCPGVAVNSLTLNVSTTEKFTTGNTIRMEAFQTSGGALNVTDAQFSIHMIGSG